MDASARQLLFHGGVVMLIGLAAGFPYGRAITGNRGEELVRGWRVAHASLCMGATTMFAVSAVLSGLAVGAAVKWVVAVAYIASGYGFSFGVVAAPLVGCRGLSPGGPAGNRLVFAGYAVGVVGSLAGAIALLYAAGISL